MFIILAGQPPFQSDERDDLFREVREYACAHAQSLVCMASRKGRFVVSLVWILLLHNFLAIL